MRRVMEWILALAVCMAAAYQSRAEIVVQGYWRFGENDSGASNGVAGNNPTTAQTGSNLNIFTPIGTTNITYTSSVSSTASTYTSSTLGMNFNGGNSFYYVNNTLPTTATNNWGIEGWFKVANGANKQFLAINGMTLSGTNSVPAGFGLFVEGGKAKGYLGTNGTEAGVVTLDPGFSVTNNQWFYLAMVRDNGVNKMYFNNSGPVLTGNNVANQAAGITFSIGGVNNRTSTNYVDDFFLTGAADEVRVFTIGAGGFNSSTDLLYPHAVPEPGTLLLGGIAAACGGGGVWWRRRRRACGEVGGGFGLAGCGFGQPGSEPRAMPWAKDTTLSGLGFVGFIVSRHREVLGACE